MQNRRQFLLAGSMLAMSRMLSAAPVGKVFEVQRTDAE